MSPERERAGPVGGRPGRPQAESKFPGSRAASTRPTCVGVRMTGFPTEVTAFPPGFTVDVFAAAFEASPTPMVVTDPRRADNPVVWVNGAFMALTGYDRDELYGHNCRRLQGPLTDRSTLDALREAITQGRSFECELLNYRKDGTSFWNGMTVNPVRDADGAILYFFSAQADMTPQAPARDRHARRQRRLEREVGERTADLRSALEQKTALLHEVDHRVKNNLPVISSLMLLKARRTPEGEARERAPGDGRPHRCPLDRPPHALFPRATRLASIFRDFTDDLIADIAAGHEACGARVETEGGSAGLARVHGGAARPDAARTRQQRAPPRLSRCADRPGAGERAARR